MIKNLICEIGFFLQNKKKKPYLSFYKLLGFYPKHLEIYEMAIRHKSYRLKGQEGKYTNNERLEFLGDAILDAIIADILYHKYPNKPEGFLTDVRSMIVKRETLNLVAKEIGLDKLLITSKEGFTEQSHIAGNALEALIGAIYIDRGYRVCRQFIEREILEKRINIVSLARKEVNFKSKLLELGHREKIEFVFETIDKTPEHSNINLFYTQVLLDSVCIGSGEGNSKKESHQHAAQEALKKLKKRDKSRQ